MANISLEPGGQFELSGAPLTSVHDTCAEVNEHLQQVREIGDQLGIGFLGLGASPTWTRAETPVMPKGRYGIMAPYMDKVGTMGRDMMFRTCTVQVNLDFGSEADMVQKLRVSVALQPIATALFANSPFLEGRPNGFLSFRSHVWTDTDNARAGMLPFAFEDGMSFERYVDYALDVPMYFTMRNGKFVNTAGESFRKFLEGKLPQLPGEKPTLKDWADHLTTIFPEVRLKRYLEMRGADSGPWRRLVRAAGAVDGIALSPAIAGCGVGSCEGLECRRAPDLARCRAARRPESDGRRAQRARNRGGGAGSGPHRSCGPGHCRLQGQARNRFPGRAG
jgi:glutamate--cysteine ligase